ncbi:MAG: ATPase, partial [Maribacter sp.]|nr:ATPase [Maribacter sp.]
MKKSINIIKYSGEVEEFNIEKLTNSLRRAKADESVVLKIAKEVQSRLKEGMTTKQIYQMAFKMLKGKSRVSASRYKLKKAIME